MSSEQVLIIGGSGFFGRLLIDDLIRYIGCDLIVASRHPLHSSRFKTVVADLRDISSLERALNGVDAAICAAGPYQALPLSLAEVCVERGIHYIDLADDRAFVQKVCAMAAGRSGRPGAVCTGWSTVAAVSGLLLGIASAGMAAVDSIHIHMAPGNRGARQSATVASLMHSVGRPFTIFRNGEWIRVLGWSEPRDFSFPPPIGSRRGYLVDVPDHEIFPGFYGAHTVEFRAGSELQMLNTSLSLLRMSGRNWTEWSGVLQRAAALLSWVGHDYGGIGVEVTGTKRRRACIVADFRAERMAVMPASVMTGLLLSGAPYRGIVTHTDWLTETQLRSECEKRRFRLTVEDA